MTAWLKVHFDDDVSARPVLVNLDMVQSIGAGVDSGARIVLVTGQHYDVADDLAALEAQLGLAQR